MPKPKGRPTKFTQATADAICERIARGEPLAVICRDGDMPAVRTVSDWKVAHPSFSAAFARAREDGFDALAAECLEIAEDGSRDYTTKKRPDGTEFEAFDAEHVQRSKLRIETRLKLLAKWDPKRYGDSVQLKHADADGGPLQVNIRQFTPKPPAPDAG